MLLHSLFILATLVSSCVATPELIHRVCSTTTKHNRDYCTKLLSRRHCACTSSLTRMGSYTTHVAIHKLSSFHKKHTCTRHFAEATRHLKQISHYFKKARYSKTIISRIKTNGSAAMTYLSTCTDELRGVGDPATEIHRVNAAKNPIAVILAVAHRLGRDK